MAKKKEYKSYLEFLETAVASENLKNNDPQKWEEMKGFLSRLGLKRNDPP